MNTSRKVLVVDDDPVVAKSVGRVLTSKGYAVIAASNGEEALNKLAHEKYDMVFTDIKMPGMSGIEVAERVKAAQPWLPVVIITGYGTEAHRDRAMAAGVSGFLNKPLSPEMIEGSAEKAWREVEAATRPAAATEATLEAEADAAPGNRLVNMMLFLASPFIGLAYIVAMPFVGLGMLAWIGGKAFGDKFRTWPANVQQGLLAVSAPFIGLVFVLTFPILGIAALGWFGVKGMWQD